MIPPMGDQLLAIISPRIKRLNELAAPVVAEDIKEKMLEYTNEGHGFGDDPYYDEYTPAYARRRVINPGSLRPVMLRNRDKALETAHVVRTGLGAQIEFVEKGQIFRYHHEGRVKGGRIRSIFPKKISSVPVETNRLAMEVGKAVLSGQE